MNDFRQMGDDTAGQWILERLHPFAKDVGSIVPDGFAAYARIFHPLSRNMNGRMMPVRWRDIAAANGRSLPQEVRALKLSRDPPRFSPSGEELWTEGALEGSMPIELAARLSGILGLHTQTPQDCWFAVWEGWGDLRLPHRTTTVLPVPQRTMFMHQGSIDAVLTNLSVSWNYRSPNLWWPDDRSWCVATEIEFRWTYVGGSVKCIDDILRDPEMEAIPMSAQQLNLMLP